MQVAQQAAPNSFSTQEAAAAAGLTPTRVRGVVRRGLLSPDRGPARHYRFTFQDMVLLRTVKGLLDALPPRRAFAALAHLRTHPGRPLSALRLRTVGHHVAVQEAATLWDAETGQGHLPFAAAQLGEVRPLRHARDGGKGGPKAAAAASDAGQGGEGERQEGAKLDSDDWYNVALDLEETAPEQAPAAYGRALVVNPRNADAHVNLGRLFQVRGDLKRATRHYQLALHAAPKHQLALYNLGTVFDELDELDAAVGYYRRAAEVPDAHYNLARIFELRGDELRSLRHMREYRQLSTRRE